MYTRGIGLPNFNVLRFDTLTLGPLSTKARIFTFFYLITAILNLALAVATIRDIISESFRHSGRKRRKRVIRNKILRRSNGADEVAGARSGEFVIFGGRPGGPGIGTKRDPQHRIQSAIVKLLYLPVAIIRETFRRRTDEDHAHDVRDEPFYRAENEDDMHLFLPHSSHLDIDSDFRDELKAIEKSDSLRQVSHE